MGNEALFSSLHYKCLSCIKFPIGNPYRKFLSKDFIHVLILGVHN